MEVDYNDFRIYMPSSFINNNYIYFYNNNTITINTRQNCYQQYNTTYCDCFNVLIDNNYIPTNTYACSTTYNNNIIGVDKLTNDIFYYKNIHTIFITYFIIIFIVTFMLQKLLFVFRKRAKA